MVSRDQDGHGGSGTGPVRLVGCVFADLQFGEFMELLDLLKHMVEVDASDIYITFDSPPMFRVQGTTGPWGDKKFTAEDTTRITESCMSPDQVKEFRET